MKRKKNKTLGKLCRSAQSPSNNSIGWYWLILGGTRSVWSGTGWYLAVLGQWKAALVDI